MNRSVRFVVKAFALAALATMAATLAPVASAAPAKERVSTRAADLQTRADHYAELAAFYRKLAGSESKHMITYFTAANRLDRLAERSHMAALQAGDKG